LPLPKIYARWTASLLGGLKSFLADYPMANAFLIYMGGRRMYEEGIQIVPAPEILAQLRTLLAGKHSARDASR
jgi:hypothetical protein